MSVIVLKKAASQTLLNHEITQQKKNRSVFLQYLIVIRKSSGCSLRDATSERDPKWRLEHVVYQKQSLHMIQIDKDNCNCHIFYEIMGEAVLSVQSPLVCVCHWVHGVVLTLTITLSVSSFGRNTHTHRRSCIILLLWKVSLLIFKRLQPVDSCPSLELHRWAAPSHNGFR